MEHAVTGETLAAQETQPEAPAKRAEFLTERRIDIFSAILLAVTTVAAAWCAYQATRWGGVQANSYAEASTLRLESNRSYNQGYQLASIDADLFAQYALAVTTGNHELTELYETRLFRPAFLPALHAWLATAPLVNPDAPRTPLDDPAYLDSLFGESEVLEQQATAKFQEAKDANQTGDDYILNTVFFASVLFFAAVASKSDHRVVQRGLLGFAVVVFVLVAARMVGMPIE